MSSGSATEDGSSSGSVSMRSGDSASGFAGSIMIGNGKSSGNVGSGADVVIQGGSSDSFSRR